MIQMTFKKPILYIDMDGVLCCFETGCKAISPDMEWVHEAVDAVCIANPRIFLTLPEIKDAVKTVEKLRYYYNIFFLSTPMHNVPESYMDKRLWLKEKFGEWADKKLILTHRKDLVKGEFLIDDRTVNGVSEFEGKHIHFGSEDFPNWEKVYKFLIIK